MFINCFIIVYIILTEGLKILLRPRGEGGGAVFSPELEAAFRCCFHKYQSPLMIILLLLWRSKRGGDAVWVLSRKKIKISCTIKCIFTDVHTNETTAPFKTQHISAISQLPLSPLAVPLCLHPQPRQPPAL